MNEISRLSQLIATKDDEIVREKHQRIQQGNIIRSLKKRLMDYESESGNNYDDVDEDKDDNNSGLLNENIKLKKEIKTIHS